MDRKSFIRKTFLTGALGTIAPAVFKARNVVLKNSDYDQLMKQVGFNHLPNKEEKTMNTILHKAETRGHANHGWLDSRHTFSFANYYNPQRMHFGVLRVLNDDSVANGRGFSTHPHDNMEIISIPLEGDLEHKDSMGNVATIKQGDIQVMSAGTGVFHSEYNKNQDKEVKFLQIWVFPNKKQVTPRYDQITLDPAKLKNNLHQILSPNPEDEGVWIHQNAWFHMGIFDKGESQTYPFKDPSNGVYAFLLDGAATIEGQPLQKRDGFGVWNTDKIEITANEKSRILLMEVPMEIGG
ncbi:MAG: pirin family protein [Saprospiraceae bacterium]|nr:pirin family protein [Saprospiraceae bacterium]MCB9325416.1 pirin family protein [Lewinellaceae bacterium]